MSQTLTIAGLTIREAIRRKLLAAFVAITVTVVGLSAWGFYRLSHAHNITSGEHEFAVTQALVLFMFMFSFVVALSASAIASPSVSSEIESGVLMTVVTRPLRRSEVLMGKWLGLSALLGIYTGAVCALEFVVVKMVSGFVSPNPFLAAIYIFLEGVLLLSVTLALSTRLSMIAAGVVGVAIFGAGWLGGVVGSLGSALNISALKTIGQIGRYLLPADGLWRGAIYYLEPTSVVVGHISGGDGDPFLVISPPTWEYLLWVGSWLLLVLVLGAVSFERREL
jgi:ABC-type transport system involved in multi-copper enzyme maturation permease subunit